MWDLILELFIPWVFARFIDAATAGDATDVPAPSESQ
jgi:hypothetical protein